MLKICEQRSNEWGFEIICCLKTCGGLHAAEARYHVRGYLYFTTLVHSPFVSPANVVSRPASSEMMAYFAIVCEWAENGELFTVMELHE